MIGKLPELLRKLVCAWAVAATLSLVPMTAVAESDAGLSLDFLLDLNTDWSRAHQALPMGVPRDYDWASMPRLHAGNQPGKFTTITGWGHVFWSKESTGHPGELNVRSFHTFVCGGPERRWSHVQSGGIEGAQFRADFKGNVAKPPRKFASDGNAATVLFDAGSAFHFWPTRGRSRLPDGEVCGLVVLLEAKHGEGGNSSSIRSGGYLIGLGADYWIDMSAPWDNFKTNKGVGVGRLKYVGEKWTWYGMSTASDHDLRRLYASGLMSGIR